MIPIIEFEGYISALRYSTLLDMLSSFSLDLFRISSQIQRKRPAQLTDAILKETVIRSFLFSIYSKTIIVPMKNCRTIEYLSWNKKSVPT